MMELNEAERKLGLFEIPGGKDEAVCSIIKNNAWEQIGCAHKMHFRLDHFTGARFGLFVYSTEQTGGTAGFRGFVFTTV